MARVYKITIDGVAVSAVQDLFTLLPATNHPLGILGISVDQSSDYGDAAEELLRYRLIRGCTFPGASGTSATPRPDDPGDSAASFTAYTNMLAIGSSGSNVDLWSGAFNIRAGLALWFPPEAVPIAHQGNTSLILRLASAPADAITMSATLVVAEF